MTADELETYCRRKYNAVSDTGFFTSAEIMDYITEACEILAEETYCIQDLDETTTTVASTRNYTLPTDIMTIKRVEYDGQKLMPISKREDDALTLSDSGTTSTGTPQYYELWDGVIYLRPIPDDAKTLGIYHYGKPIAVVAGASLEVPTEYHRRLSLYVLHCIALKDENPQMADRYEVKWEAFVSRARSLERKKRRGDSFAQVQDMESLPDTILGVV